jgi:ParB-like chromosome segregation protein Spo0J
MDEKSTQREQGSAKRIPLPELGTTLGRARCPQPGQIARMRLSLTAHGQMTPVIAVEREGQVELVDGFKRRLAAVQMGWGELAVSIRKLDELGQWAAMLTLNRTVGSMSVLEESLILRELCHNGLTQVEVGQLVSRHKSWVSRRLGLVERLHPDLVEWVRTGLMTPGTARRLIVLPAGNQLELAAVVSRTELTTEETELLVSLWRKTRDAEIRRFLLTDPRSAIQKAREERSEAAIDPRLGSGGRTLAKALAVLRGVVVRTNEALHLSAEPEDMKILRPEIEKISRMLPELVAALGSSDRYKSSADNGETSAMPYSADCSAKAKASGG